MFCVITSGRRGAPGGVEDATVPTVPSLRGFWDSRTWLQKSCFYSRSLTRMETGQSARALIFSSSQWNMGLLAQKWKHKVALVLVRYREPQEDRSEDQGLGRRPDGEAGFVRKGEEAAPGKKAQWETVLEATIQIPQSNESWGKEHKSLGKLDQWWRQAKSISWRTQVKNKRSLLQQNKTNNNNKTINLQMLWEGKDADQVVGVFLGHSSRSPRSAQSSLFLGWNRKQFTIPLELTTWHDLCTHLTQVLEEWSTGDVPE